MVFVTVLLFAAGQTLVGAPGDVLMRPVVPDERLLAQEWVQRDLSLPPQASKEIMGDLQWSPQRLRNISRTGQIPPMDHVRAYAQRYQKRLAELTLWANDLQALTNPTVGKEVGLSASQQSAIDRLFRSYYQWCKDETERKQRESRQMDITKSPSFGPDPKAARAKMLKVRDAVRATLTASQWAAWDRIRGKAPATIGPFGWSSATPYVYLPNADYLLSMPRVHEELGFTMRQSRLTIERLAASSSYQAEVSKLSPSQRARLDQLGLQRQGPMAILRCDISAALKLDEGKRDRLLLQVAQIAEQDMGLQSGGTLDQRRRLWDRRDQMLLDALTPIQRQKWNALVGVRLKEIQPLRP